MEVWEMLWFVGVTVGLHSAVIGGLNAGLAVVERYDLFKDAKIQRTGRKPQTVTTAETLVHLFLLYFVLQPIGLPAYYVTMKWRGIAFSGPAPPLMEMFMQIVLLLFVDDTAFYWMHRLFHTPFLYKRFHKLHHRYYWSKGLAAEYFHPVEYMVALSAPLFLGPVLLKCHVYTFWVWLVIRLAEAVDGHCGYDFWFVPFRYFPFRPGANVHDYHHTHNTGNYGSFFTFWDTICGTDVSYNEFKKREREER